MQMIEYNLERQEGGRDVLRATVLGGLNLKPGGRVEILFDSGKKFSGHIRDLSHQYTEGKGFTTEMTATRITRWNRFRIWCRMKWWNTKWRLFMKWQAAKNFFRRSHKR